MEMGIGLFEIDEVNKGAWGYYMTIKETIIAQLRHAIVTGKFKPGEHLREQDLCNRFSVSRTPVREALNQLENEGLITVNPHAGARVINLTVDDISHIYDMLIILEGAASGLACLKIAEDEMTKLEECHFMMGKAASENNLDLVFELNAQFHWLITEYTKNSYLIDIRKNFRTIVNRFLRFGPVISGQLKATLEEHPKIIDAIKSRNPSLAEFVTRNHMENAKKFMIGYYKNLKTNK